MNLIDWEGIARAIGEFELLTASGIGTIIKFSLIIIGGYAVIKRILSK